MTVTNALGGSVILNLGAHPWNFGVKLFRHLSLFNQWITIDFCIVIMRSFFLGHFSNQDIDEIITSFITQGNRSSIINKKLLAHVYLGDINLGSQLPFKAALSLRKIQHSLIWLHESWLQVIIRVYYSCCTKIIFKGLGP